MRATTARPGRQLASEASIAAMLAGVVELLTTPLPQVAQVLSRITLPHLRHSALVIVSDDDVDGIRRGCGDESLLRAISDGEVDSLREGLRVGQLVRGDCVVAGRSRSVAAALTESHCLAVFLDSDIEVRYDSALLDAIRVAAFRLGQKSHEAAPDYLLGSRVSSRVRTEAISELTDIHSTTLESLLAVLRTSRLDDSAARATAINLAAEATVQLRSRTDEVRSLTEEAVTTAFERLQSDLRPLVDYRDLEVQFVEPPVDGRALPSEVAFGARAVVRSAILASLDQTEVTRVRVQWDCDGQNLLIDIRDDGPGMISESDIGLRLRDLKVRVLALNGHMAINATAGWGLQISVAMPLDPPPARGADRALAELSPKELLVLQRLATGMRNRAIAADLGISENTVKFHLSKIFRKLDVSTRTEAISIASVNGIDTRGT